MLNKALYTIGQKTSPLCRYCQLEEETSQHILFNCAFVDNHLRQSAHNKYRLALNLKEEELEPDIYTGLLTAVRNSEFMNTCNDIVVLLDFDVTIILK